jgi:hypothetical protein
MMGGSTVPLKPIFNANFKDTDGDGVPDNQDPNPESNIDSDFDGWSDDYEKIISGTDWTNADSDGDDLTDSEDLAPRDPNISWDLPEIELPTILGQDTARIFIDSDRDISTGYHTIGLPIGADYMLEIAGKYGYIFNSNYQRFIGTEGTDDWNWEFVEDITVGTDASQLETQINLNKLDIFTNQEPTTDNIGIDIFFHITDWANEIEDISDGVEHNIEGINELKATNEYLNTDIVQDSTPRSIGTTVLLNEIFPNNMHFEWIELYNPTAGTVDVGGWTIQTKGGGKGGSKSYTFPTVGRSRQRAEEKEGQNPILFQQVKCGQKLDQAAF